MVAVPHHAELVEAMLAYDLIGFQTVEDRRNFEDYLQAELGLNVVDGTVASDWGLTQLATSRSASTSTSSRRGPARRPSRIEVARLRDSLKGAKLVLGVDRLDYSKGLANRMHAFDRMLELEAGLKREVALLQVAVPSRGNIKAYRELKAELAALVGESTAATAKSTGRRSATQQGLFALTLGGLLSLGAGRPGDAAA